jgi:uncharacterized membrane protein
MITTILFLAVIVLAYKVYQSIRRMNDTDVRFNLLERQLASFEQKLKELRPASKPAPEAVPATPVAPAPAKPAPPVPSPVVSAPVEKPPVAKIPAPAATQLKIETPKPPIPPIVPRETPPVRPPVVPPPPSAKSPGFDWESLVGVKLFSWIAGVALLLAAVFFLRYSINQGWLMPPVRMAIASS